MILKVNKGLDKWDLCFVIYMFLSNNPSSGDINSSNLSCLEVVNLKSLNSSNPDSLKYPLMSHKIHDTFDSEYRVHF